MMSKVRFSAWVVVGVALGSCVASCVERAAVVVPPLVPKAELANVRVLMDQNVNMTWTDNDCAASADANKATHLQDVETALSQGGFQVVTDPTAPHDAVAHLSVSLNYCGSSGAGGTDVLSVQPGAVVTASGGLSCGSCAVCSTCLIQAALPGVKLVEQLQSSPQVLALAQRLQAPPTPPTPPVVPARTTAASTSVVAFTPPPSPAPDTSAYLSGGRQPNAYALVIGIEHYRDLPSPTGARADAQRFAALAKTTLGIPDANIRTSYDDHAGKNDIQTQLAWLASNVPTGGRIYFFFSGHGAPDASQGTPYVVPYDASLDALTQSAIPLDSILQSLAQTHAKDVLAVVDSCFSGAGGRSLLPKGARPLVRMHDASPKAQVALFSASSGSEISGPALDGSGGLFTTYVVQGIGTGAADVDGDGTITLGELGQWVTPRVTREAKRENRAQTPLLTVGSNIASANAFNVAYVGK